MSFQPPPKPKELQEFQFKLLARLRLSSDNQSLPLKQPLSLVAAASKFGLICVGTSTGFIVIETAKVVEKCVGEKKLAAEISDFPSRNVTLNAQPSHLDVSCDCQLLAVGFTVGGNNAIRIYDVTSLTAQTERVVHELRLSSPLQALSWNPGIPNVLAACMQEGSATVYDFKNNSFDISSIPPEAYATCICWSPKGKQIVVGSRNGALNQFKPDLKIVKSIPPPQGDVSLVSVQWLSSFQYAAVYTTSTSGASLVIINTPRNSQIQYVNYEDITYSNGDTRITQFYFILQQTWNVLLVGSANSMEIGVLGMQGDWEQWQQEDAARAELPLSASRQETHPVGMALDTSMQYNLPWGENQQLPAMPLLLLLSDEGLLTLYWTVNLMPGATPVCEPVTPLPDTSGLHLFTTPQSMSQVASSPQAQVIPIPQTSVSTVPPAPSQPALPAFSTTPAPTPQWQQSPPSAPAKLEFKPATNVQGSWMTSAANTALSTSMSQSAFSAATPAFGLTPTKAPVSAFNVTSTASPTVNPASTTQPLFNFAPTQATNLFNKPGAFVSSSSPVPSSLGVVSPSLSRPPQYAPDPVEVPAAPSLPSPVSSPSPEPEVTEESQELKAMNDALIQESIREEISHFEQELAQLGQKVRNVNINVFSERDLEIITEEVDSLSIFMQDLQDTTAAQVSEVESLRSFLLNAFSYIESMRTRLRLQSNPDYMSIQKPQGLDPIQSLKMRDIQSNLQCLENQLSYVNNQLTIQWAMFNDYNKENRNSMQIPSIETIYQSMVMQNNLMMTQKNTIDNLDTQIKRLRQKKLIKLMNMSRMIEEDSKTDFKDSDFSKIAEDFVSLNLDKLTSLEELQNSVRKLNLSAQNFPEANLSQSTSGMTSEKMRMFQQVFADNQLKLMKYNRNHAWTTTPVSSPQGAILPIITSTLQPGSISSGHPIFQSSTPKLTTTHKEAARVNATNEIQQNFFKESKENVKSKLSFNSPTSGMNLPSFNNDSPKNQYVDQASPVMSNNTATTNLLLSSQNFNSPSTTAFKGFNSLSVPNSSLASPMSNLTVSTTSSLPVNMQQITTLAATSASTSNVFTFSPLASSKTTLFQSSPNFGSNTQAPAAGFNQPLIKTTVFNTVGSTNVQPAFTANTKTEISNAPPSSTIHTPFKFTSSGNALVPNTSSQALPANSNPLAFLSSMVSGIEPLQPSIEASNPPNKVSHENPVPKQPFVFKIPSTTDNKSSVRKETENLSQKTNVFGLPVDHKLEENKTVSVGFGNQIDVNKDKNQTEGSLVKLTFEPSSKSIFGGTPSLNSTYTDAEKVDHNQKNICNVASTTSNVLCASNLPISTQSSQKSLSGNIITSRESESLSPVIEVSLTPIKSGYDIKSSIEKISAQRDITITRVESPEKKSDSKDIQPDTDTSSPPFSSLNHSSFTTPTKSQTSFVGLSPSNSSIMYETGKPDVPDVSKAEEIKPENRTVESEKNVEPIKVQSLFGGGTSKDLPSSSFTFSTSTFQNNASATSNQAQVSTGFSFSLKSPATTVSASASSTTGSTFSVSQVGSPSLSTAFSFLMPSSTSVSTANTNTFDFGNLSSGSSADKSKTGFTFGEQVQAPASTTQNIFGGVSSKSEGSNSSTDQIPISNEETKSIFGDTVTSSDTKSVFGQLSTTTDTKDLFVPTSKTTTDASNLVQPSSTAVENKIFFGTGTLSSAESIFGQTPSSTAENKSIFGLTTTSSEENKNIFGQSTSNSESKGIFGQTTSETAENKNIFGQTLTISSENKNVFEQTPTTAPETKNIFGQATANPTENKGVFGQTSTTKTEQKHVFGQSATTPGVGQTEFSFSLPTSTTSSQSSFFGTPATTAASFFGQPICSPSSISQSPFGQPTSSTPAFGSPSSAPFGSTSSFGSKPAFGQSGGSFFGQTSGGFGASGGSVFGGGSSSMFNNSSQPSSPFVQTSGNGTIFGGGSFSGGGQSVGQTGFGNSTFQAKPAFGSTSPPAFGSAPTFGGSPAFGSPPKVFGNAAATPTVSAFGGSPQQQQSSAFENMASQNTMTFGNLAQNQSPGFGTLFSPPQNNNSTPAFPPANTGSVFGGSSFSSWR